METKPVPDSKVIHWINSQAIETLWLPSVALAEWLSGVERLPVGKRRSEMERLIQEFLDHLIGDRIAVFDRSCAEAHARLRASAERRGTIVTFADCQIAAIASVRGFTVATRDVDPFIAMGIPVINPWDDEPKVQFRSLAEALASDDDIEIDFDTPASQL